ncbi:VWA domain-containing protein [Rhodobacteraceae bacterium WD3A24]|nr:VWA domain-containing protein [Rhodobacteraceae bacterium WD3A24]
MAGADGLDLPEQPRLAGNITHFARALRAAGLPIGPGRVVDAIRAVEAAGFSRRRDFYWTLHACFVSRPEHSAVFAQIFRLYWRDPRYLEHMLAAMLPAVRGVQEERAAKAAEKRAAEALLDGVERDAPAAGPGEDEDNIEVEADAAHTASDRERLRQLDFEQMSTAEMAAARRMLARLALPVRPLKSRRLIADARGARPDMARTLRAAMRRGGEMARIERRARRDRWPDLVVLCDISGSMSAYSRVVLHFLHAVANSAGTGWGRVHAFTFGTRLTNITRHMRARDVDAALAAAGAEAQDWEGGTRIGRSLRAFNRDWSRRVLGPGAVVVLITDGLERDDPALLATEAERLHLSARRVIWINPLLRWAGFAPRAAGIRALLPHVDCFRAGHNIASLEALADVLANARDAGEKPRLMAALRSDG